MAKDEKPHSQTSPETKGEASTLKNEAPSQIIRIIPSALDNFAAVTNAIDSLSNAAKPIESFTINTAPYMPKFPSHALNPAVQSSAAKGTSQNAGTQLLSPSDFGSVLREARKVMGLTQLQLADLAGVGRRFISECESGKPRLEFGKVLQVAAAAGIDLFAKRR